MLINNAIKRARQMTEKTTTNKEKMRNGCENKEKLCSAFAAAFWRYKKFFFVYFFSDMIREFFLTSFKCWTWIFFKWNQAKFSGMNAFCEKNLAFLDISNLHKLLFVKSIKPRHTDKSTVPHMHLTKICIINYTPRLTVIPTYITSSLS